MTRLEAAERAVVEAALDLAARIPDSLDQHPISEACARLRDLRELAQAEECLAMPETMTPPGVFVTDNANWRAGRDEERPVHCYLPRGHEGEHCGSLGDWRWT